MSYIAKRKNRLIRIAEEKAEEYSKMGYNVMTEAGENVLEPRVATMEGANLVIQKLRKELAEKDAVIKSLEIEKAELMGELKEAKGKVGPVSRKGAKNS